MLKAELLKEAQGLGLTHLSKLRKSDILDLVKKAAALRDRAAKKTPARKAATRKVAAKKAAPKKAPKAAPKKAPKAAAKKAASKKAAPKKAAKKAAPKAAPKKAAPKKVAAKKAPASKAPKRVRTRKPAAKAPARKTAAAKAPAAAPKRVRTRKPAAPKKAAVAKAPARKAAAKSALQSHPARVPKGPEDQRAPASKAPANKAPASKAAPKKAVARKAPARAATSKAPAKEPAVRAPLAPVPAQADAQSSRFPGQGHTAPEALRGVDERLPELPENYGDNRIVLMPRDPGWLFTYWDLTQEYKVAARQAGGQVLALRLYDVSGSGFKGPLSHACHEHECAEWARSWYLPVPAQGRQYQVEIGYRGGNQWYPLARSNMVEVPTNQPAQEEGEDFASIAPEQELGESSATDSTEQVAESFQEQVLVDDGDLRITAVGNSLFKSDSGFSGQLAGSGGFSGSLGHQPGSLGQAPGHQAGSLGHQPGSLGHQPGSLGHQPGSLGHLPGSLGQLWDVALGPDQAATLAAGQQGGGPMGPGDTGGAQGEAPTSLMEAMVEVVISGRSAPGARLTVAGQPIPAGPDGCFSLRISVPEGQRVIPLEALEETTGKEKRINLRLGQDTE